jgi:hypothetical protein
MLSHIVIIRLLHLSATTSRLLLREIMHSRRPLLRKRQEVELAMLSVQESRRRSKSRSAMIRSTVSMLPMRSSKSLRSCWQSTHKFRKTSLS